MTVLLLLIPLSLVLLGVAVWAFIWAVGRGQFDDLDSPALDILVDRPEEQARGSTHCDVEDAQAEGLQGNGHAD
jgi:cbb3-type cytochrome oxidase maturation protein